LINIPSAIRRAASLGSYTWLAPPVTIGAGAHTGGGARGTKNVAPDTLAVYDFTACLPLGAHLVTYTITDDCGNTSSCTFRLTVDDGTPPVSACDEFTQVGLGGDGLRGAGADAMTDARTARISGERPPLPVRV